MDKELIDIAIKCGFKAGSFKLAPVVTMHSTGAWVDVTPELAEFAKMVEQVTLEKAAGVLSSAIENSDYIVTDLYGEIDPVARRVVDVMVTRVLALKDSHE